MTNQPVCIFILGRPGSGKDTQAELLAERFSLHQVRTSKLLVAIFKNKPDDPEVQKAKAMFDAGELATHEFVRRVVYEHIEFLFQNNFYNQNGIIFSGSPRTLHEAQSIVGLCIEKFGKNNVLAIDIEVSEQECIERIKDRLNKETDKHDYISKTRMQEFENYTRPAIEYCNEEQILARVNGEGSLEQVLERMSNVFSTKWGYGIDKNN